MNKARLEKLITALEGVKTKIRYDHMYAMRHTGLCAWSLRGAVGLQKKFTLEQTGFSPVHLRKNKEPIDYFDDAVRTLPSYTG
jgi:hypothetical protein